MALLYATLFLLIAYVSCMEMRETVERMVMVRRTGSDLQPAATGYIYKRNADGPVSLMKMGESEVIEHFDKLYEPESYIGPSPIAAGPFYVKEDDTDGGLSISNEDIIKPVVEDEESEAVIDGIADEDYTKMFEEYAKPFNDYRSEFSDYFHGLKNHDHGLSRIYPVGDYGSKRYHDFSPKGQDRDSYDNIGDIKLTNYGPKHVGYTKHEKGSNQYGDEADPGKHYTSSYTLKGNNDGTRDKGKALNRFHKHYDHDENQGHHFHDGTSPHTYGHRKYSNGYENGDYSKSNYQDGRKGDKGYGYHYAGDAKRDDEPTKPKHNGGVKGEQYEGKSYSYNVKH